MKLPETKAAAGLSAEYDHTAGNRPAIRYRYQDRPAPAATEPLESQRYTDFAELAGDLVGIKDPQQVHDGGPERVTFAYDLTTGPDRDRNLSQSWATGETATFGRTENTDVLGQRRAYTYTPPGSFDGREHIESTTLHDVPVMTLASAGLPDAITATETPNVQDLTTSIGYNDEGLEKTVTMPNGTVVTNNWIPAGGNAPGMVLSKTSEQGASGALLETDYGYDSADNARANVFKVGKRDDPSKPFVYRDQQTPSRNRQTITNADEGVQSSAKFNANGQVSDAFSSSGADAAMKSHIEYYPESVSNPIESGRPKKISRGNDDVVDEAAYSMTSDGVETEVTRNVNRGVVTTIKKDAEGRMIARTVVTPSVSSGGSTTQQVTSEAFGYNADGRLAFQSRSQSGVGTVETRYTYDALGRPSTTTVSGARVLLDPVTAGSDDVVSLTTITQYDVANRSITDVDPAIAGTSAAVARTVTRLDGLGRTIATRRVSADGSESVDARVAYDINGKVTYQTDGHRVATLTRNDAFGRPVEDILADGTRDHVSYDAWDEVVESQSFERKSSANLVLMAHGRSSYTANGRLRLSADRIDDTGAARATAFSWQDGDAVTTQRTGTLQFTDATFADTAPVRAQQITCDLAGRVTSKLSGEAAGPDALIAPADTFAETRFGDFLGDLPTSTTSIEPRAARQTETTTGYDGLGRPISVTEGGTYTTLASYDEAGNQLMSQNPGQPPSFMSYDSRGLMWNETLPDGKSVRRVYDERGTLRQYIDEEGQVTFFDTDGLGRTVKVRYPDGTNEETRYENGTGLVLAQRDRSGQWIWFKYDPSGGRLLEEDLGGNGTDPSFDPDPFVRYAYDDGGRLTRIASADAAIEYDQYDLLGRPHVTRTIRYTKTGCIPAAVACGSGLTDAPQIAEVYTQGHEWSVFDGERLRWRMPAVGATLPSSEPGGPWHGWIAQTYDGAGNITAQQTAAGATATPDSRLLTSSIARGSGRLAERKRSVGDGSASLTARLGYADLPQPDGTAVVPVASVAPGRPVGNLGRMEIVSETSRIAGTEITLGPKQLIESARDLGMTNRTSNWDYDARDRLETSTLLRRNDASSEEPRSRDTISDADARIERKIEPSRLGSTDFDLLGATANQTTPLSWYADVINAAHQIEHRKYSNDGVDQGEESFSWQGGRRAGSGAWTLGYDVRGRLVSKENDAAGRRIVYDYDPNDRVVGRTAWQKEADGSWTLETRTTVLARDGLPAETTFVWDPISDTLIAMYDSAIVRGAIAAGNPEPDAGLLRQILHGDQGYDDPVEVLVAPAAGEAPSRYLPIVDEAGAGSLQAVTDGEGNLVERVLYADAYGDAPRYIQGAVADRIDVSVSGGIHTITISFTEPVDPSTVANGVKLTALAADQSATRETTVAPVAGDHTIFWTLDGGSWDTLTAGAASLEIAVADSLRFAGWGDAPLQTVADWETKLGRAEARPGYPLVKKVSLSVLGSTGKLYDVPDLYLVGRQQSKSNLLFDFHVLPFREPADGTIFVRARWYDPGTGSFVSPDPLGYKDSSDLYAYAGNDPVNMSDPSGNSATVLGGLVGTAFGAGWAAGSAINDCLIHDQCKGAGHYFGQAVQFGIIGAEVGASFDTGGVASAALGGAAFESLGAAFKGDWGAFGVAQVKGGAMGALFGAVFEVGMPVLKAIPGVSGTLERVANSRLVQSAGELIGEGAERVGLPKFMSNMAELSERTTFRSATEGLARREAAQLERHAATETMESVEARSGWKSMEPCPIGSCLIGNTDIATPGGFKPIEELHVGDRVATTGLDPDLPDGSTAVDAAEWYVVKMEMPNPADPNDAYEIEMLRPVGWIVAHEAYPGRTIELATERKARDAADVISVEAVPPIAPGSGRVVLATYAHQDEILSIRFAGMDEAMWSSPWHRLFSIDRHDWITARDLTVGERVRTKTGEATIAWIGREFGAARVFDIEVEGDHAYFLTSQWLLSHNCGMPPRRGVVWVSERTTAGDTALEYQAGAFGARSSVLTRQNEVPALLFDNPNAVGKPLVRFDGLEGNTLIDRKLSVTTKSKQLKDLRRVGIALRQNPGYRLRIEVPTEGAARQARRALRLVGLRGVAIRVVPR
ncbi:MAG: RHS repeat-associated core domain-containing protein [Thermoanaerobaculia bacterium]